MKKLCVALALALVPVAGCSMIAGGSGSFTADGDVYKVSKVECRKVGAEIAIRVESGAAAADLAIGEDGKVRVFAMGAKQQRTMLADPGQGIGEATGTVDGTHVTARGKLVRATQAGETPKGPGTEEVGLDVTCNAIKG